jgi:hypothetical protein
MEGIARIEELLRTFVEVELVAAAAEVVVLPFVVAVEALRGRRGRFGDDHEVARVPQARGERGWRIASTDAGRRNPRRRSAFVTTLTLLAAIAAAARMGSSSSPVKG